jgi:hypothetical protein
MFIRQFRLNEDRDRHREDDPDITFDAGHSVTSATLPATGIVHHTALLPLSEGSVAIDHVLGKDELSLDACRRGALNAGQYPSFTEAAERHQPSSIAGLISITMPANTGAG